MTLVHDDIDDPTIGPWVRLVHANTTIMGLRRWPGPHRRGETIHATGGGRFDFDHLAPDAADGPEVIYTQTA